MKILKISIAALLMFGMFACNQPVTDNDLYNTKAAGPQKIDISKLKVINTSINKKDSTMSILYGNNVAYDQLKKENGKLIDGAMLTLMTWKQQTDPHWFGANIPGDFLSVEIIQSLANDGSLKYKRLLGTALKEDADTLHNTSRTAFIIKQRPSVMP